MITEALEVINNTWCAPPLPLPELMTLIRYAVVQGDRPDFAARHVAEDLVHDAGERVDERKPASLARARVQVRYSTVPVQSVPLLLLTLYVTSLSSPVPSPNVPLQIVTVSDSGPAPGPAPVPVRARALCSRGPPD